MQPRLFDAEQFVDEAAGVSVDASVAIGQAADVYRQLLERQAIAEAHALGYDRVHEPHVRTAVAKLAVTHDAHNHQRRLAAQVSGGVSLGAGLSALVSATLVDNITIETVLVIALLLVLGACLVGYAVGAVRNP